MILGLDAITVRVAALAPAVDEVSDMLGARPVSQAQDGYARFLVGNVDLLLEASSAQNGAASGLTTLTFACADLGAAERLLKRRGLASALTPDPAATGGTALTLAPSGTYGVGIALVGWGGGVRPSAGQRKIAAPDRPSGLDHVVVRTPSPDRAVALYGGRLGLDLRLDRSNPAWGSRLLFFRSGDLVVEISHDLRAGVSDGPDRLWGLAWRVPDLDAAHRRLAATGISISEVRTGRRPGSRVMTVKSHTGGVPTLLLEVTGSAPRDDA